MAEDWQRALDRWTQASFIDSETASRIRKWETQHSNVTGLRWPVLLALAFGTLLMGAGVLLFVSAHWDELSPAARMTLVVTMVAMFHVGGALTSQRFESMSIALHATGTISVGAGIALSGQIFNLSAHWSGAILLWAVAAMLAWAVLRDWTQAALTAILAPAWIATEIFERHNEQPGLVFLCLTAFCYLTVRRFDDASPVRRALCWIGGIALIETVAFVALERAPIFPIGNAGLLAWIFALAGPLLFAVVTRGSAAWMNGVAALWVLGLSALSVTAASNTPRSVVFYFWCVMGAIGLCAWGIHEKRVERVNLGTFGFAVTLIAFYFAQVMDKLGRSASLIGLGILFLAGGWALERLRRRLAARIKTEPA